MNKFFNAIGIVILLFSFGFFITNYSYAAESESVSIDGYFNILEKRYKNGHHSFEYYLFEKNGDLQTVYELNFDTMPHNLFELSGKNIHVNGFKEYAGSNTQLLSDSGISVDSIDEIKSVNIAENNLVQRKISRSVPEELKTVVILSKVSDVTTEPHLKSYFQTRFFTDPDSLNAYWEDTSYGAISMSEGTDDATGVTNWNTLPENADYYFSNDDSTLARDAISLVDSIIDFNGADNIIQNSGPQIGGPSNNGDDIDQVIFVVNADWARCSCAYAYLDPFEISTSEGNIFAYVVFTYDSGDDFPVGINFENGVGTIAHEMGHNFEWEHTPPPTGTDTYADPWSLMSGGDADGPPGVIAFNKDQAGWIPDEDKIGIPAGTENTITLDILSDPSPGSNYLMAKIPFGSDGEYYTLEARKDSEFDQTPLNQFGLMIYHYNPNGHTGSPEDSAPVNVVDTTGISDWENTNLALGESFTSNGISIDYLSDTATTITVKVTNSLTDSLTLDSTGTVKLKKAVTKGTPTFSKGTYDITVQITADIDSVNSKGIPKLSNIAGTFTIDGDDSYDAEFTKLKLTVDKKLKLIKWTAKEGSGQFTFADKLDFTEKTDQDGKKSTIKIKVGKASFAPKVSASSITFS